MKRIYIAGPMRGYNHYNFPAFDAAAERLARLGFEPVSPADMDRYRFGFNPERLPDDHDWNQLPEGWDIREVARRCCDAVIGCDGMLLLRNWDFSSGAMAEQHIGFWLKLPMAYVDSFDSDILFRLNGGDLC